MPLSSLAFGLRLARVALHLVEGAIQVALRFPFAGARRRSELRQAWSRRLLRHMGIEVAADPAVAQCAAGLLAANHVSFVDVFVINAVLPSGFVAKSEVAHWPLIGWLCRHNETIFIERGNRRAAHGTQLRMVEAMRAGRRLAIFPEGTTTRGDHVLPFHGALFQAAVDAGTPVAALTLRYVDAGGRPSQAPAYVDDTSLFDCLRAILANPGLVAHVTLAATLAPPFADRRHLSHRAHGAIAGMLARTLTDPSLHALQHGRKKGAIIR